jgi:hypothetical protein
MRTLSSVHNNDFLRSVYFILATSIAMVIASIGFAALFLRAAVETESNILIPMASRGGFLEQLLCGRLSHYIHPLRKN